MKKIVLILVAVSMALPSCKKIEESIDALDKRLDKLEQESIPTIGEQIVAINLSLDALKEVDRSLDESIKALEASDKATAEEVATLKDADKAIEDKIEELEKYIDDELKSTKDWVNATFATLEQFNALSDEVAALKEIVDANKAEVAANLATAISKLETSLTSWVGEQLSNYYTIAEVDALLAALEQDMDAELKAQKSYLEDLINKLSEQLTKSIADNKELIEALREDLSSAQDEIATNKLAIADNSEQISKNATKITANAQAIAENSEDIDGNNKKIDENKSLIQANETLINNNKSTITFLQTNVDTATRAIAKNAEDIAKNAALISANATAIGNNAQAISENANSIAQLKIDINTTATEITEAYKMAINDAISTNNGVINGKIANEVATINTRISNEVAAINATIKALTERVKAIEVEISVIKQQIAEILSNIADMKEQISTLIARIQSVSYIPKYSDGKVTISHDGVTSQTTLDFEISPKDAVVEIAKVWESALNLKAVYTETRAVPFVDMPIFSFEADTQNGVISVTASGENLSAPFFADMQEASVRLAISDGNSSVTSEYIPMVVHHIAFLDSHNACIETWYENWNTSSMSLDGNTIYVDNIRLIGDITSDNVLALGVIVTDDDTFYKAATQSATLEISPIQISGLTSGVYTIRPYAKISINGEVLELFGVQTTKIVTSIPTISDFYAQSSYSYNGEVRKDNEIFGDELRFGLNLSDSYVAQNLVEKSSLYFGANLASAWFGYSHSITSMRLGEYDCYSKVVLKNGYTFESPHYTTHITGIPYVLDSRSNDNWSTTGSVEWNADGGVRLGYISIGESFIMKSFHIPENIDVSIENSIKIGGAFPNGSNYNLYISNATTYSKSNTSTAAESLEITPSATLYASAPTVRMSAVTKTVIAQYVTIRDFSIKYLE